MVAAASSVTAPPAAKHARLSETVVVYTDGCAFKNGRQNARGGIGVFWGDSDSR